jgi:hypothetical protein
MPFSLTICGLWLGMKVWPEERISIIVFMTVLYGANMLVSFTNCCKCCPGTHHEQFIFVQATTIIFDFILVIIWYYFLASEDEIELYYDPIFEAFLTIFLGFVFYSLRFPEKFVSEKRYGTMLAYIS